MRPDNITKYKKMPTLFSAIIDLMRLRAPTGYLLCLFPAYFGLLLGYRDSKDLIYIPLFFLASVIVRGAGCTINDLWDRDFDGRVERTKSRPLPSGRISVCGALILLFILACISIFMLMQLSKTAIYMGLAATILIAIYPLMKRFTHFPQVFLGFTFNMGVLIGFAAVQDAISTSAIIMYLGCGFWTLGFDTIYGFSDIKDDKKIGVKSTAIFFEKMNYKLIISCCYAIFFLLFYISNDSFLSVYIISGLMISISIAAWSIKTLNISEMQNCIYRFKINNYIGFILFLAMLLEKL